MHWVLYSLTIYVDKYLLHRSGWTFEKFFFIGFLSDSRKKKEEEEKKAVLMSYYKIYAFLPRIWRPIDCINSFKSQLELNCNVDTFFFFNTFFNIIFLIINFCWWTNIKIEILTSVLWVARLMKERRGILIISLKIYPVG